MAFGTVIRPLGMSLSQTPLREIRLVYRRKRGPNEGLRAAFNVPNVNLLQRLLEHATVSKRNT